MASYEIKINRADLAQLYVDAAAAPGVIRSELDRGVRNAGVHVKDAVVRAAAEFSVKIPGKVRLETGRGSVRIVVDDPSGEAGALNNKGRAGMFKHPVWGHRDRWVSQTAHPFFRSSAQPAAIKAEDDIRAVMDNIAHRLGFH